MADDFSELYQLAADLESAPKTVGPKLRQALEGTAFKVKEGAQQTVRGRAGFGHAASAIDYELKGFQGFGATVLEAEIGYDKNKNGAVGRLGNLIEFGAPKAKAHMLKGGRNVPVPGAPSRPLAPSHDLGNALLNNEDDFERGVARAVDDALRESGL